MAARADCRADADGKVVKYPVKHDLISRMIDEGCTTLGEHCGKQASGSLRTRVSSRSSCSHHGVLWRHITIHEEHAGFGCAAFAGTAAQARAAALKAARQPAQFCMLVGMNS